MTERKIKELIEIAIGQLAYSYTPYSHFRVGAALLGKNGMIYTGCNRTEWKDRGFHTSLRSMQTGDDGILLARRVPNYIGKGDRRLSDF